MCPSLFDLLCRSATLTVWMFQRGSVWRMACLLVFVAHWVRPMLKQFVFAFE